MPGQCTPGREALEIPGRRGEEADLVDHRWHLFGHGQREWLAGVLALGPDHLFGARVSMASAIRIKARLRSEGVVRFHSAKAVAAT